MVLSLALVTSLVAPQAFALSVDEWLSYYPNPKDTHTTVLNSNATAKLDDTIHVSCTTENKDAYKHTSKLTRWYYPDADNMEYNKDNIKETVQEITKNKKHMKKGVSVDLDKVGTWVFTCRMMDKQNQPLEETWVRYDIPSEGIAEAQRPTIEKTQE